MHKPVFAAIDFETAGYCPMPGPSEPGCVSEKWGHDTYFPISGGREPGHTGGTSPASRGPEAMIIEPKSDWLC